jgi:O-6-methylguanine DNA methyltransferase
MITFREKVFNVVKKIPKGMVLTYGEVARRAGFPRGARAVGSVLKTNFDPAIPCHRVIRSDGSLGGYNRGKNQKRAILIKEGYNFYNNNRQITYEF